MSTSRLTAFIGRIGVFLISFVASVPVAEAVFRCLGDTPSYDLQGLYVPFGQASYRLGSMVNTDAFWAAGRVSVYTDALGLRCDVARHHGARPGDAVDMLLLGDSQGFGNGVNYEDSVAGSLAELAAQAGYRVSNASVGGHSLATQVSLVHSLQEDQGLRVSNVVVLLTPVMMTACDQETRAVVGQDGRLYDDTVNAEIRLRLWLKTHAVIYSRVRDALRNYGIGTNPARSSPAVFDFYRTGEAETKTAEKLYSCLQTLVEYSSERDMGLQVVYLPSVVEGDFDPVQRAAAARGITLDADVPFRIYSSVMERLGRRPIDLKPILQKLRAEGHALTVKADFHYSAELSRAVSAGMWSALGLPLRPMGASDTR